MKLKILILIAGVAGLASCGPSYRVTDQSTVSTDTIGVPYEIKSSFSTQYPTATNVIWTTYDASATRGSSHWWAGNIYQRLYSEW